MLKRGWLSSCKFKNKIVFQFKLYINLKLEQLNILPLPSPRKSDTVLGTEESCLALATGLWQDETVSKKEMFSTRSQQYIHKRCGTTSLATTRRSGSARTVRSCSRRWGLLEHLVDKRRWTCINSFGRDFVVFLSKSYKCRDLLSLMDNQGVSQNKKPPHHITGGARFEEIQMVKVI